MTTTSIRKILILYVVPVLFLLSYFLSLIFNEKSNGEYFFKIFSGAEFILIGSIAVLEFVIEIYFSKNDVQQDSLKRKLDIEFLMNIGVFIFSLIIYGNIRFVLSNESLKAGSEVSVLYKNVYLTSIFLGVCLIIWSIRTLKKIDKLL